MHLVDFIETKRTAIVKEWVRFAKTLVPLSEGASTAELRDHAEELRTAPLLHGRSGSVHTLAVRPLGTDCISVQAQPGGHSAASTQPGAQ